MTERQRRRRSGAIYRGAKIRGISPEMVRDLIRMRFPLYSRTGELPGRDLEAIAYEVLSFRVLPLEERLPRETPEERIRRRREAPRIVQERRSPSGSGQGEGPPET